MQNRHTLATALRRRLAQTHPPREGQIRTLGPAAADACLGGGLRCGALHEIFPANTGDAAAASGFALALATRVITNRKWLLWVQQDFAAIECGDLLGTGVSAFGFDPACLMIVRVPTAAMALRAAAQALTCTGIGAIVIEPWDGAKIFDLVASRKLTLGAAKHGVTVFALRHASPPLPSTAETRWRVRACLGEEWENTRFDVELLRNRHGPLGRWIMEWDCDGNFHETGAAHRRAVSAPAFHRPPATQTESLRRAG
jgi:protein ImuA